MLVCALLNVGTAAAFEIPTLPLPPVLLGAIAYTAVVSLGMGYTLQVWAQRHTPPTEAAIILSMESVFAALAGAFLLHEYLNPIQLGGCGLIILAVLLSQWNPWSRMQQAGAAEHT